MGGFTIDVPHGVEDLGIVVVVLRWRRGACPIGSAGIDLGAIEFSESICFLQLEEAGGKRLAAFALPGGWGRGCCCSSGDSLAEVGGVIGAGCDVVGGGEGIAGRLRVAGGS